MERLIDADKLKNIFLKSRSKVFDYRIVIQEIAYAPTVDAIPRAQIDEMIKEIEKLYGCTCSCSDGIVDDVIDIIHKYTDKEQV